MNKVASSGSETLSLRGNAKTVAFRPGSSVLVAVLISATVITHVPACGSVVPNFSYLVGAANSNCTAATITSAQSRNTHPRARSVSSPVSACIAAASASSNLIPSDSKRPRLSNSLADWALRFARQVLGSWLLLSCVLLSLTHFLGLFVCLREHGGN